MLSLTLLATPTLYGASLSMPSLSSLNPFGGTQKKEKVVLASDQNQKSHKKKKKQKSSLVAKAFGISSTMGYAIMGAPSALMHSRMTKRLARGIKSTAKDVLAIGPNTIKYASSKKGKQKIKSALKTGLYYGIPVMAFAGGLKCYADQQHILQRFQEENQMLHQRAAERDAQLSNGIAQVDQRVQDNTAIIVQVRTNLSEVTHRVVASAAQVENLGASVDRLRNGMATSGQLNILQKRFDNNVGALQQTQQALQQTQQNLDQLHQYLQTQQQAAVQADIKSGDDALKCCWRHLEPQVGIQLEIGDDKFEIGQPQKYVGEGNQIYTIVPVEVVGKTQEVVGTKFGGFRNKWEDTYQGTFNAENALVKDAVQKACGNNARALFWYKDGGERKSFSTVE